MLRSDMIWPSPPGQSSANAAGVGATKGAVGSELEFDGVEEFGREVF
jgi:hypothetical protein